MQNIVRALVASLVVASVSACGGSGGSPTADERVPVVSPGLQAPSAAPAGLVLEGLASDAALVGQAYLYLPTVADAGGAPIAWRVEGAPSWLTFDADRGALYGVPAREHVGRHTGIRLIAASGGEEKTLVVDLEVVESAPGYAALAWERPTQREDGSAIAEVTGFRIYYGKSPKALDSSILVSDPSITEVQVSNLTRGTWYFAAAVLEPGGHESDPSVLGSKTIG